MNATKHRAVRVQFFAPVDGKTDYFFGSIKAIFDVFKPEVIGLTLQSLYAKRISEDRPAVTPKCLISRVAIIRSTKKTL